MPTFILSQSICVQKLPGCWICLSNSRGFARPFSWEKEAASFHLAHCEKPLINLFKKVISLIRRQRLHFLCILTWFLTLQPFLAQLIVCASSCVLPCQKGETPVGEVSPGRWSRSLMQSLQWLCPLPQVRTGQGRIFTWVPQVAWGGGGGGVNEN